MDKSNAVLKKAMQMVYNDRKPLKREIISQVRTETVNDGAFCEVWFMTKGCTHDAEGGCTMCNYGKGYDVDETAVVQELARQVRNLPEKLQELIVTPSGSMLDDEEVPKAMRERIFELLNHTQCEDFYIETRAYSITREKLESLRGSVNAKRFNIEIGAESCDDWIMRNCINKKLTCEDLQDAVDMIHAAGMYVYLNIGIGIPFLTEHCSIEYAKKSIRKAFAMGCDSVVLFPYHVKPGTLLWWLWKHELYSCCSLWAIPEVLSGFTADELERIHISWYRNYYTDKSKIVSSPAVEEENLEQVLLLLDEYKNHPGIGSLTPLMELQSEGRTQWALKIKKQSPEIEPDRVRGLYTLLADAFGISREELDEEWKIMEITLGRRGFINGWEEFEC